MVSVICTLTTPRLLALLIVLSTAMPFMVFSQNDTPASPAAAEMPKGTKPAALQRRSGAGKPQTKPDPQTGAVPVPNAAQQKSPTRLSRWFELQTATLSTRYRWIQNSDGVTTNNELQHSEIFRGRFKFDSAGRYAVNLNLATGNAFTAGWNPTGIGTGHLVTNLYLKQLYFSAKPVKGLEIQYGGLHILRGESTEITSYDNDGYIVGQRISVKRPKDLFFDELSATYAYLGDLNTPSIFHRFHRLSESNYHQFLLAKTLGKVGAMSADYTLQSGAETLREAVKFNTATFKVVDTLRFELYQRLDVHRDAGFAITADKAITKRLTASGGFASIDRNYGGLNGDRFNRGQRIFVSGRYKISPQFELQSFFDRAVSNPYSVANRNRFELILSYDLLSSLKKAGLL